MSVSDVVSRVCELAGAVENRPPVIQDVVLTGGEPMLFEPVVELCSALRSLGFMITIETAGTVFRELQCDLMSISPKLANSDPGPEAAGLAAQHAKARLDLRILERLVLAYVGQLKFVVNPEVDLEEQIDEIENLVGSIPWERYPVLLMPEGIDAEILRRRERMLVPVCMERGWRLCPRRHIEWFGNTRGT
jgi:7-carboxy-7-deazaguanine synthase